MGLDLFKTLLCDIRSVEFCSIVPNEVTDVSCKEQMIVCIRWVDEDLNQDVAKSGEMLSEIKHLLKMF